MLDIDKGKRMTRLRKACSAIALAGVLGVTGTSVAHAATAPTPVASASQAAPSAPLKGETGPAQSGLRAIDPQPAKGANVVRPYGIGGLIIKLLRKAGITKERVKAAVARGYAAFKKFWAGVKRAIRQLIHEITRLTVWEIFKKLLEEFGLLSSGNAAAPR